MDALQTAVDMLAHVSVAEDMSFSRIDAGAVHDRTERKRHRRITPSLVT